MVKFLINQGANVNLTSPNGVTVLHLAAGSGSLETVQFLIEKMGHNHNISTIASKSRPVHSAAKEGHILIVKYLVERGVDPSSEDKNGEDCLSLAIKFRHGDLQEMLI